MKLSNNLGNGPWIVAQTCGCNIECLVLLTQAIQLVGRKVVCMLLVKCNIFSTKHHLADLRTEWERIYREHIFSTRKLPMGELVWGSFTDNVFFKEPIALPMRNYQFEAPQHDCFLAPSDWSMLQTCASPVMWLLRLVVHTLWDAHLCDLCAHLQRILSFCNYMCSTMFWVVFLGRAPPRTFLT